MSEDVECPYCGVYQEINHDDGYGYEEGKTYQQECSICGKTFGYETSIIFYYKSMKMPCSNGGNHKWKPTITIPKECTRMRCEFCDETRQPTDEERELHGIPKYKKS